MVYGNNIILLPSLSFAPSALLSGHRNSHRLSALFRYQNYFCSKYPLTQNGTCWYPARSEQWWQYISWPIRSHRMVQKQPIRSLHVVPTCLISDTSSSVMPNSSAFFCSDIMYLNTYLVLWTYSKVQAENIMIRYVEITSIWVWQTLTYKAQF